MSLQIWLPLNGNLNNIGLSNVSVTNNGATVNASGKIGSCYSFTSSNSNYLQLPQMSINRKEMSFCIWAKYTAWDNWSRLFDFGKVSGGGDTLLLTHNGSSNQFYIGLKNGTTSLDFYYDANLQLNTWYHFVVTKNNLEWKLYLNGVLVKTTTVGGDFSTDPVVFDNNYLGRSNWSQDSYLSGSLNDFRIYDHCLSAKEVEEISKGLAIHYKLNNLISGNLIEYDCSGYKYNGTYNVTPTTINKAVGRFEKAIHFTKAATCLIMPSLSYITSGTVSLWVNIEALGTNGWLPLTGQSASYYILATSGGTGSFYNGGVSGTITYYLDGNAVSAPTNLTTGWHHIAITGVNLSSWTSAVLNAYGGVSGTGWNSTVNYSDFRIYATALSASQIKELYNTSVSIDKGQNIFERELIESDDYLEVDITKTGIIKAKEINETTQSGIYKTGKITANAFYEY